MKSRTIIKLEAKNLINTNSLWLALGLPQAILGIIAGGSALTNKFALLGFVSVIAMIYTIASELYLYQVIHGNRTIAKTFTEQFKDICSTLNEQQEGFATYLLSELYRILWALIPLVGSFISIVKNYSYGLAPYIAINAKTSTCSTCGCKNHITLSRHRMNGHKGDWFVQHVSFIGWSLLVGLTFGLAAIYVSPYMIAADVLYANEVLEDKK